MCEFELSMEASYVNVCLYYNESVFFKSFYADFFCLSAILSQFIFAMFLVVLAYSRLQFDVEFHIS